MQINHHKLPIKEPGREKSNKNPAYCPQNHRRISIVLKSIVIYVIVACTFLSNSSAQTFTWIPDERSERPEVVIIGPIVDPDRVDITNTQRYYIRQFDKVITRLIERPGRYLPETYLDKIRKLRRQRWNPEEEGKEMTEEEEEQLNAWLEIAGDGTFDNPGMVIYDGVKFDANNVKIADILRDSYAHIKGMKSHLELALRLNLDIGDFETRLLVDGYRLAYDQRGLAKVEWFAIPISISKLSEKEVENKLMSVVGLQLILPFYEQFKKEFEPGREPIPFWKTSSVPGHISSKSAKFELEETPIARQFGDECKKIGRCMEVNNEGKFVVTADEDTAIQFCSDRRKYLIRKSVLPYLYLQHKELMEENFYWVEDSMVPMRVSEGDYGHLQIEAGGDSQEGMVWCRQVKSEFISEFKELDKNIIVRNKFGWLHWYLPDKPLEDGYLFSSTGNNIEVIDTDENHPTIMIGKILMDVNEDLQIGSYVSYDILDDSYSAITVETYQVNVLLATSSSNVELAGVPVTRLFYTFGKRYSGYTWSAGISLFGVSFMGRSDKGDNMEVNVDSGNMEAETIFQSLSAQFGLERPSYLITNLSWSAYVGVDMLNVQQTVKFSNLTRGENKLVFKMLPTGIVGIRLIYKVSDYLVSLGMAYGSGAKTTFEDDMYFREIEVVSGQTTMLGASYVF